MFEYQDPTKKRKERKQKNRKENNQRCQMSLTAAVNSNINVTTFKVIVRNESMDRATLIE